MGYDVNQLKDILQMDQSTLKNYLELQLEDKGYKPTIKKGNLREVLGKSSGEFMQKKSNNQKKNIRSHIISRYIELVSNAPYVFYILCIRFRKLRTKRLYMRFHNFVHIKG